eukprot:13125-Prymnesium_polylepis.1
MAPALAAIWQNSSPASKTIHYVFTESSCGLNDGQPYSVRGTLRAQNKSCRAPCTTRPGRVCRPPSTSSDPPTHRKLPHSPLSASCRRRLRSQMRNKHLRRCPTARRLAPQRCGLVSSHGMCARELHKSWDESFDRTEVIACAHCADERSAGRAY